MSPRRHGSVPSALERIASGLGCLSSGRLSSPASGSPVARKGGSSSLQSPDPDRRRELAAARRASLDGRALSLDSTIEESARMSAIGTRKERLSTPGGGFVCSTMPSTAVPRPLPGEHAVVFGQRRRVLPWWRRCEPEGWEQQVRRWE